MDNNLNVTQLFVCRTCLQGIDNTSLAISLELIENDTEPTIGQKLLNCIPELDLKLIPNAVICTDCYKAIAFFNEFKSKCLQTEIIMRRHTEKRQEQTTSDESVAEVQFSQTQSEDSQVNVENQNFEFVDIESGALPTNINFLNEIPTESMYSSTSGNVITVKNFANISVPDQINKLDIVHKVPSENQSYMDSFQKYLRFKPKSAFAAIKNSVDEKPFKCSICDYRYSSENNLQMHIKIHSQNKKSIHSDSDFQVKLKLGLQNHIEPLLCPLCDYQTYKRTCMKRHMRTHVKEI